MMKRIKDFFTGLYQKAKGRFLFYIALLLIGWLGIWYTYHYAIEFSSIPITFLYMLIFFGAFELFDTYILTEIDTINEIKDNNTAVSQLVLAIAVLLHAIASIVG
jgi:hypothetical protein